MMKDRYLFKAKRISDKEWIAGYLYRLSENNPPFIMLRKYGESYEVDEHTICQCTGLKDKNGNLIWENDFVKCVDENNDIEFTAIVKFGNPNWIYSWGYQLQHIKGDKPNLDILLWVGMKETGVTCEVIGNKFNKFDNPELRL